MMMLTKVEVVVIIPSFGCVSILNLTSPLDPNILLHFLVSIKDDVVRSQPSRGWFDCRVTHEVRKQRSEYLRCHDLGKQVSQHVGCVNLINHYLAFLNNLSNEVEADINVLRSLVVDRVVSEIDGAFIVTPESGWHSLKTRIL
jgi:hypothetical protein